MLLAAASRLATVLRNSWHVALIVTHSSARACLAE